MSQDSGLTFSFFKIKGFSKNGPRNENFLQLKASKGEESFIEPLHILNFMEKFKYCENIDSEIEMIDSSVIVEDKEYFLLHLTLFRGKYMPIISQLYFKHLFDAITLNNNSPSEKARLSKLWYFSVKSLKALNINLETLLGSPEDANTITKYGWNYCSENLKINQPFPEILKKGLDSYSHSERYEIIMKLLKEIYLQYPEYQKAMDPRDDTQLAVIFSTVEESMKHFDFIFDYIWTKIIEDFNEISGGIKGFIENYRREPIEEGEKINSTALKRYQSEHFSLFQEYCIDNKNFDHLQMLLIWYSSCYNTNMSKSITPIIVKNYLKIELTVNYR